MDEDQKVIRLINNLGKHKDFPIKGIEFVDVCPLFRNPELADDLYTIMANKVEKLLEGKPSPVLVGLDARGFIFASAIAQKLNLGWVLVRKKGKLPGKCIEVGYEKEYGKDWFELQEGMIKDDNTVVIIDDLLATGGTASAAGSLVRKTGATVVGFVFAVILSDLKGSDTLGGPAQAAITL